MSVKGFLKNGVIEKYDYNALENKPTGGGGDGLTEEAKQALLQCFQKTAYIDTNGQTYYQALYDALYANPKTLTSISASYTQSGEVLTTDSLDSLRKDIVVTAYYSDSTSATVTDYSLSGNLTAGTSTVTVYYNGQTDTISANVTAVAGTYTISNHLTGCTTSNSATTITDGGSYTATITASSGYTLTGATANVTMGGNIVTGAYSNGVINIANVTGDIVITVTAAQATISSITAVFNQGTAEILDTDRLEVLKQYLVVTANNSDGTTTTVSDSDYVLSGTLLDPVSTITVTYAELTDTFTVNVSVTIIPAQAYMNNTELTEFSSTAAREVRKEAFRGCSNLTNINLPNVTKLVGGSNFYGAWKVNVLNMKSLQTISGEYAFYGVGQSSTVGGFIGVFPDIQSIDKRAFLDVGAKALDFGPGPQALLADTFYTTVDAPTSNKHIDVAIFRRTDGIVTAANTDTIKALFDVYVPQALISSYESASNWSTRVSARKLTFHAIEGSIYENAYADGTPIT